MHGGKARLIADVSRGHLVHGDIFPRSSVFRIDPAQERVHAAVLREDRRVINMREDREVTAQAGQRLEHWRERKSRFEGLGEKGLWMHAERTGDADHALGLFCHSGEAERLQGGQGDGNASSLQKGAA